MSRFQNTLWSMRKRKWIFLSGELNHNKDSLVNVKKLNNSEREFFCIIFCLYNPKLLIFNEGSKPEKYIFSINVPHISFSIPCLCFDPSLHPVSSIIHKLMARQWGVSCQCMLKDTAAVASGKMEVTGICNYFCCKGFVGWASGCGPVEQHSRSVSCLSKLWEASVQLPPTETFQASLHSFLSFCWLQSLSPVNPMH